MKIELPPIRLETQRTPDVVRRSPVRSPRPGQAQGKNAFEQACVELMASERAVQTVILRLQSGRQLSPGQLLEAQMAVYHNLQRVEFLSKCLQAAQSTLQQLRQG
ncbi:MAG: hypothetical protein CVU59_05200 [Deltaproteobacteria bacterium HGW-Deltaproteobacteria-17]|nr:MAG: hypothetical protein CVU59_05200 [Deltaproteobacteria bacterium HGW-Deltaproteobacteria-17]